MDLLSLQAIDKEIDALKRSRRDYPQEIEQLEKGLEEARGTLQERQEKIEELERSVRHFERELALANEDLKRHQDRLYEVTSNREYDALQNEIEACRNRIDEAETEILNTMTALEETQEELARDTEREQEIETTSSGRVDQLRDMLNAIEEEAKGVESRREEITVRVEPRLLRAYDRIRKAKEGLAVVPVTKGACGGCFRELPPQLVNEVRKMNRIIPCESCGRFLIWKDGNGAQ